MPCLGKNCNLARDLATRDLATPGLPYECNILYTRYENIVIWVLQVWCKKQETTLRTLGQNCHHNTQPQKQGVVPIEVNLAMLILLTHTTASV